MKEFIQQESAANPLGIGGLLDFRGFGFRGLGGGGGVQGLYGTGFIGFRVSIVFVCFL